MKLIALAVLCFAPLAAAQQELVVELATEGQLLPLYLLPVQSKGGRFDSSYTGKLDQLLRFDLANNGKNALLPANPAIDKLAADEPFNSAKWSSWHLGYFVKTELSGDQFTAAVVSIQGNWVKKVGPLALTGELSNDRRHMHEVADAIHEILFGARGVAATRILYTVRRTATDSWAADLWEADYDGGNARQLLTGAGYCVTPQYAPPAPGARAGSCFFVSYKTGQPKIYMANIKSGQVQRFSTLRGNQLMPTLSRQRDKIAFISDVTGNPDLFIQEFSSEAGPLGKPQQLYAGKMATQGTPSFSPDGKQIAFVSNNDGSPRIYITSSTPPPPGAPPKATLLTKFRRGCTAPSWSPDGTKIAYCAHVDRVQQLFVHDLKTGVERQLTQGPGNKENATWAPNSLHLVYNSNLGEMSDLYLINLNQAVPLRITSGPGEKRFPHWEPR